MAAGDVGDAQVKEATHHARLSRRRHRHQRFVGGRPATGVQDQPGIGQLDDGRIARADHTSAQYIDIEGDGAIDVGNRQEKTDEHTCLGCREAFRRTA